MSSSEQMRYQFMGLIGAGAMGQIHLAREHPLLRHVAFKTLHRQMANQPQALRRFLNEMQITSQLDHPNIVPIYGMEVTADGPAYTMKLVRGQTLKELIQSARQARSANQPVPEACNQATLLDYFLKVCEAMHYAHSKGVLHRDLKPANIMIGPYGEVYVMDWGIARVMGEPSERPQDWVELGDDVQDLDATQTGQILGTPRYMSPQQAAGRNNDLDGRSDQFALGAILFELLTLQPAFRGDNQIELLKRVLKGEREPFRPFKDSRRLDRGFEAIVAKAMGQKPDQRYRDVAALADDLRRQLRGEAILARPDSLGQKCLRLLRRHQDKVLLTGLLGLIVTITVVLGLSYRQYQIQQAARQREQKLQTVLNAVLQQSRRIDGYFLSIEKTLDALSAVVSATLERGVPDDAPLFRHNGAPPADFGHSSYFDGELSLDYAINIPASQLPAGALDARMHQLSPLRRYFRQMLVNSATGGKPLAPAQERKLIAETGVPVMWGTVVLAEGLAHWYPGKDLGFSSFDPRTRPYYTSAAHKYGHYWGSPYIDGTGSGMLLSCSSGLYDSDNHFLGTASLDLKIDYIIKNLMNLPAQHQIQTSYLLNGEGKVLVSSAQAGQRYAAKVYPELELKNFSYTPVIRAVRQRRTGYLIDGDQLYTYAPIPAVNWYLVTVSKQP